jgi:ribosomal protein S16
LQALVNALAPLLGAEAAADGKAVTEGWANNVSQETMDAWTEKGKELTEEVTRVIQETSSIEYGRLMRKVRFSPLNREEKNV